MANNDRTLRLFDTNIEVEATDESNNYDQSSRTLRLFGVNIEVKVADEPDNHDPATQTLPASDSSSGLSDVNNEVEVAHELDDHDKKDAKSCSPDTSSTVIDNEVNIEVEDDHDRRMRRSMTRYRGDEEEEQRPVEEIPAELLQAIEELNGTRPVFLYRKRLEESDIRMSQNRLFVNNRRKFMTFWSVEELEQGVDIMGVDANKIKYNLGLKIWKSLDQLVVKNEWYTLVRQNGAEKGQWVQIWGFKVDGTPYLAISFARPHHSDSACSCGTKNGEWKSKNDG